MDVIKVTQILNQYSFEVSLSTIDGQVQLLKILKQGIRTTLGIHPTAGIQISYCRYPTDA